MRHPKNQGWHMFFDRLSTVDTPNKLRLGAAHLEVYATGTAFPGRTASGNFGTVTRSTPSS